MSKLRKKAHDLGNRAEFWAGLYFQLRGYRVVARRYKTRFGEIDLILKRRNTIVFLEVKARRTLEDALSSIHKGNRQRIENASMMFVAQHPELTNMNMRFDCIGLVFYRNIWPIRLVHLDNAWLLGS